jgi:glutamyl-tRNA synthetase
VATLRALPKALAALPDWTAAAIEGAVEAAAEQAGIPHGKLNQPLRAAVTGTNIGAGVFETLELIGRERTLKRLEAFPAP